MSSSSISIDIDNPAASVFSSATLEIVKNNNTTVGASSSSISLSHKNKSSSISVSYYNTRAYYRDSSGRARVHLRVRLTATTSGGDSSVGREEGVGLEALIECGCITPTPLEADGSPYITVSKDKTKDESAADDEEDNDDEDNDCNANNSAWYTDTTCTFDCTCVTPPSSSSKNNKSWALEGVTILHCEIERSNSSSPNNNSNNDITALLFDIEVAVRGNGVIHNNINNDDDDEDSIMIEILEEETLELCAVLRQKRSFQPHLEPPRLPSWIQCQHWNLPKPSCYFR